MEKIKIQCPSKDCGKEIDFTFESPEECPRCGRVLFKAIDELANEVARKVVEARKEVEKIFEKNNIKSKILTEIVGFPGCAIIIKNEEGIKKIEELIEEYNKKYEKRKRLTLKRGVLLNKEHLVIYPRIAAQDARIEIRKLEMYRFFQFIINKKHT